MNPQRHVILRQTLELTIVRAEDAWPLQQEASHILRKAAALIERCCDELSSPDRLHRIERLELDLGKLDPQRLEEDFLAKFGKALRHGLAGQIDRQESTEPAPVVASQLELFEQFVRQGCVPWWADLAQPGQPQQSLNWLLHNAPDPLKKLLPELVSDAIALSRLAGHFDDLSLAALAVLPLPSFADFPALLFRALLAAGSSMTRTVSLSPSRLRMQLWQSILQTAVFAVPSADGRLRFFQGVTRRWAILLSCSQAALLDRLALALPLGEASLTNLLETLLSDFAATGATHVADKEGTHSVPYSFAATAGTHSVPYSLIEHLPEPVKSQFLSRLESVHEADAQAAVFTELAQWLDSLSPDKIQQNPSLAALLDLIAPAVGYAVHTDVGYAVRTDVVGYAVRTDVGYAVRTDVVVVGYAVRTGTMPVVQINAAELSPIIPSPNEGWLGGSTVEISRHSGMDRRTNPSGTDLDTRSVGRSPNLMDEVSNPDCMDASSSDSPWNLGSGAPYRSGEEYLTSTALPPNLEPFAATDGTHHPNKEGTHSVPYSYSNTDKIYLVNAGLVILWPFLNTFFDRLGLLEENRFCNDDVRQRGVALLQYLVNEELAPPEYLLPLNKLLCGMALDAVFDLEHPLIETETDECDTLLEAVIAQAPILNNMSIAGFRGSFLLRQGILSTRDGAWLLRVERETYDLVLDRFPWGFAWVKLPWMELPLQVEW